MADDLIFPPNDPFPLVGDLNDDVLSTDINPAFPQSELLNIPQLVPPIISPSEDRTPYTPISQLMKQTEQLAATLDQPLNSNANDQLNFSHLRNNSSQNQFLGNNIQNTLLNNNSNLLNTSNHISSAPNTQCLVVGGQRIQIPPQQSQNENIPNLNVVNSTNTNMSAKQINPELQSVKQQAVSSNMDGNSKQSVMLKMPQNSQLKGQIVKTADQRLMFVTEVNGKRVGYIIQQAKPPNATQQTAQPSVEKINISQSTVISNNVFQSAMLPTKSETLSLDTNLHQQNVNNNGLSSPDAVNIINPVVTKKEYTKTLKEKLQNLRNPTKTQNFKFLPSLNKTLGEKIINTGVFDSEKKIQVHPVSQIVNTSVSSVINDFDAIMKDEQEMDVEQNDDEEGQEIEFSENDLTGEFNENSNDSLKSPVDENMLQNNDEDITNFIPRRRTISTDDDEDSLPLSQLKHESENAVPGLSIEPEIVSKTSKKGKASTGKASSNKAESKGKKKSKSKKKKKDEREPVKPLLAYQVFFRDRQGEVRVKQPQLTFGELSKIVAHMWEVLDENEKKVYQDTYSTAKAEYDVKMKNYKDLLAKEVAENTSMHSPAFNDEHTQEAASPKKTKKTNTKKKKKSPVRKKPPVTMETIETTIDRDMIAEVMASDEIPIETILDSPVSREPRSGKPKSFATEDYSKSPSLPSSDSSSEDDSESAIIRMRQRAAELKKKISEEKKAAQKNKTKENTKRGRQTKMEVTTISMIEEIEPVKEVKKPVPKKVVPEPVASPPPTVSKSSFKIPKKSTTENGQPSGPRLCARTSCNKPAKITRERGGQYCSNECLVLYCREVFDSWVIERQAEETVT